ncbi:MAG: 16S rRNA (cytosine(1402)-N(4))-methyltransferase RsmH [Spirochaetales bacterium]|nr:16S rRNA (cytosine(1402)-N(4))-methyltransferase RsmH [Spirochaetales bacterium]
MDGWQEDGTSRGVRHVPVMLDEVLSLASALTSPSLVIDATLGAGGHAAALLEALPSVRYIGIDADPEACARSAERLQAFASRLEIINTYYDEALAMLRQRTPAPHASFMLFDLGLSMFQLGASGRGFSLAADEPLDMRFSPDAPLSAAEIVNSWREEDLADLIYKYGEERYARRIARAIVHARRTERIRTASRLAWIIGGAVPPQYRHGRIHPATRTFQALRIAVNDELGRVERAMRLALDLLAPGGILAVISFHSLEDRIVKQAFAEAAKAGRVELLWKKPREPGEAEIASNPPSRSAKLRAVQARELSATSLEGAGS